MSTPAQPSPVPPRVLSVPAASGKPRHLAVLLHGVGADAASFLPVAQALAPQLPDTEFLVPDGLFPFEGGPPGRQWFSIRGVTTENRPGRVAEAGPPLSRWIDAELARRNLPGERLIIIGFSQGAIMGNWLALHRTPAPEAVVSLSGLLSEEGMQVSTSKPRVLVVHGDADTRMPVALAQESARGLEARGAQVQVELIPGLGHGVDGRVLTAVETFLASTVGD